MINFSKKTKPTKYPYYLSHSFFIHTSVKKVDFLLSSWQTEIVLKLLTTYFLVKQNNHFELFAAFHYLFGDFCWFICFHDLSNFEILHPFLAPAFQLILDFYLSLYKKIDIVGEMQTLIPFDWFIKLVQLFGQIIWQYFSRYKMSKGPQCSNWSCKTHNHLNLVGYKHQAILFLSIASNHIAMNFFGV